MYTLDGCLRWLIEEGPVRLDVSSFSAASAVPDGKCHGPMAHAGELHRF